MRRERLALYGLILIGLGLLMYAVGVFMALPRRLLVPDWLGLQAFNQYLVWYSGVPFFSGVMLMLVDLFVLYPKKRSNEYIMNKPLPETGVTVVLTAYNDAPSIGDAVRDFLAHPLARRVVVISNNSTDDTLRVAQEAGAIVHNEPLQGYGACVHRALSEGCTYEDTALVVLCEGDLTFRARDIDKLLAYLPHADIVAGTRTVEQLRDKRTQMSTFIFYGNLFVGKLLEIKHLGQVTLTDVGTTYKLCRSTALRTVLPRLNPRVNLEFNPYFLDMAIQLGLRIVEAPVTFHQRVGQSKGGNVNNRVALRLGLRMIGGIVFGWRAR